MEMGNDGILMSCRMKTRAGRWMITLSLPDWLAADLEHELLDTDGFQVRTEKKHGGKVRVELTQPLPLIE